MVLNAPVSLGDTIDFEQLVATLTQGILPDDNDNRLQNNSNGFFPAQTTDRLLYVLLGEDPEMGFPARGNNCRRAYSNASGESGLTLAADNLCYGESDPLALDKLLTDPASEPEKQATKFNPKLDNGQSFLNDRIPGGPVFLIDFTEMARKTLGESIWSVLEVGQGPNNDMVIPAYGFDPQLVEFNLDITTAHIGRRVFAYLDYDKGGLGVCQQVREDDGTKADQAYPGTAINRCWRGEDSDVGEFDSIQISPDRDIWIGEVRFTSNETHDFELFGANVEIEGTPYTFVLDLALDGDYYWTPPAPYLVPANTYFEISNISEDFYVKSLAIYSDSQNGEDAFQFTYQNKIVEEDEEFYQDKEVFIVDLPQTIASILEPAPLALLLTGLFGLAVVRHWHKYR